MHRSHELIERYLNEVGKRLLPEQRDDVVQELRSLLLDGLEDRAADGLPAEEAVVETLRQMGPPEQMAARYGTRGQYLIGPGLYPVFLIAAKYTFAAVAVFVLLLPLVSVVTSGLAGYAAWSTSGLLGWALDFVKAAVFALGLLVLVFAVAERLAIRPEPPAKPWQPFDPRSLPAVPTGKDPDRISPGWQVAEVYWITALFAALNFFPRWAGLAFFSTSESGGQTTVAYGVIPISALGIHVPLLLFDLWWLMAMALDITLLRQGRWTPATRWMRLATQIAGLLTAGLTLAQSGLAGIDPEWLRANYPGFEALGPLLRVIVLLSLAGGMAGAAVRAIRILLSELGGSLAMASWRRPHV